LCLVCSDFTLTLPSPIEGEGKREHTANTR
jgi:hypothetical protein